MGLESYLLLVVRVLAALFLVSLGQSVTRVFGLVSGRGRSCVLLIVLMRRILMRLLTGLHMIFMRSALRTNALLVVGQGVFPN